MTKYQKAKDAAGRVVLGRPRPIVLYPGTSIEVLTPREVEVLAALASGMTVSVSYTHLTLPTKRIV